MSLTTASIATYNVLNPYHAVKWSEHIGLNNLGRLTPKPDLDHAAMGQSGAWKSYSNWSDRVPPIARNICLADIVCLQEINSETIQDILALCPEYKIAGKAFHEVPKQDAEHGNAILYRASAARLEESFKIFFDHNEQRRVAVVSVFEIGGLLLKTASVHLKGYYLQEPDDQTKHIAQERGYKELLHYQKLLEANIKGIDGLIIAGDFNEGMNERGTLRSRITRLGQTGYQTDGNLTSTRPHTTDGRIDWLFYKHFGAGAARLVSMNLETIQERASDHLMTGTQFTWPK